MNDFKGRHFGGEIVLWAVRWYCRYAVNYRDPEAMMTERGVAVGHSTILGAARGAERCDAPDSDVSPFSVLAGTLPAGERPLRCPGQGQGIR